MKAYSRFATAVAAGDLTARLRPQGTDEWPSSVWP